MMAEESGEINSGMVIIVGVVIFAAIIGVWYVFLK